MIKRKFLAGLLIMWSGQAIAQTDLSMFSGSVVNQAGIASACAIQIDKNEPGYFPFCGNVIIMHLGDKEFREFYEGDGNNPFLTQGQAVSFARQTDQVNALRPTLKSCLESSLNLCLAALSSSLFVTSYPYEPEWVPGEIMLESQSLEYIGYKLPVYDELARFDRQLNRKLGLGLIVSKGGKVEVVSIRAALKEPNVTYAAKSGILEALQAIDPSCGPGSAVGIQALKDIFQLTMEDGENGEFVLKKMLLCGRQAEVFRFQPKSNNLEAEAHRINITFRMSELPLQTSKPLE